MRISETQPGTALVLLLIWKGSPRARREWRSGRSQLPLVTDGNHPRRKRKGTDFKTLKRAIFSVKDGLRFYNPDTGRWLNRDPIGELGGATLYAFLSNAPLGDVDPNGEMALLLARMLPRLLRNLLFQGRVTEEEADRLPAIGFERVGSLVLNSPVGLPRPIDRGGIVLGDCFMFFPSQCEFAHYKFVSGNWARRNREDVQGAIMQALQTNAFGLGAGIGASIVAAQPLGADVHDADSWLGWFYTASASVSIGPVGMGAGGFYSSTWAGGSLDVSVGPPGVPGSLVTAGLWYSWYNLAITPGPVPLPQYYDLDNDSCVCRGLRRALAAGRTTVFQELFRTLVRSL